MAGCLSAAVCGCAGVVSMLRGRLCMVDRKLRNGLNTGSSRSEAWDMRKGTVGVFLHL